MLYRPLTPGAITQKLILLVSVPLALSALFLAIDLGVLMQTSTLSPVRAAGMFAISVSLPLVLSFLLLKKIGEQLHHAEEKLRAAESTRIEYASMMMHDMRTPLAQVCFLMGMLAEGEYDHDPAMRKVKIEKVLPEVTRLTRLIEDLLTFDKLKASKLILAKEPTSLRNLLQETKDALELESMSRGMTLSISEGIRECLLNCDAYQVKRVLINLCSNALKYSRGGADILLNAVQEDSGWMQIEVWDEGPGIPDAQKQSLFDAYQQADDAMAKFGFGLGLSIAKSIVTEHGGTIAIRDRDDQKNGAIVSFTLPLCEQIGELEL